MSGEEESNILREVQKLSQRIDDVEQQATKLAKARDEQIKDLESRILAATNARNDQVDVVNHRLDALEANLPKLIETKIDEAVARGVTSVRNLILWLVPLIMAVTTLVGLFR